MVFHMTNIPYGELPCNVTVHRDRVFGNHFHRGHELIYVLEGSVEAVAADCKRVLEQGDFAMILSNQVHRLRFHSGTVCWICVFSPGMIPAFDKAVQGKTGTDICFSCDTVALPFLRAYVLVDKPKANKLMAGMYLACDAYLEQVALSERDNRDHTMMNRITDYVGKHFREPLSLQDVARSIGYDYHYVSRRFRYVFNMRFTEYVNSYRINAALDALRNTSDPIAAVAADCGFQSVRNFNGVFRQTVCMTPQQYREKHR